MTIAKQNLPLLPIRDMVIFPGVVVPIFIGRNKSINALNSAKQDFNSDYILITAQKLDKENPKAQDLYKIGVIAKILQTIKLPNNNAKILIEATQRVTLNITQTADFFTADYKIIDDREIEDLESLNIQTSELIDSFKKYVPVNKKITAEIIANIEQQKNTSYLTNLVASHLICSVKSKQQILEETNIIDRTDIIHQLISSEISQLETEQIVQIRVKKQIEKTQRDFYLNEQMKAIQKELEGTDEKSDFFDIEKKIKSLKLSKEAKEKAEAELKKLKHMNPMSAESSIIRNYLDTLLGLPWSKVDKANVDITHTSKILNRDHFGLEKIKERILEYIAVLQRSRKLKGPILCLIGPPGVGKTSLVKSIAEAINRKYVKFALGGVRDEAEIRGHRKTYLGSMPGKIISLIKKAKVNNPVLLLDEIDKMGSDARGDPSAALLEVLDPEQNSQFVDHYLEVAYDLSDVMFIATANSYNLPRALIDRMEVIDISGYIEDEKLQIAKHYLIPKQIENHTMKATEISLPDQTILHLIRYYTRESGVRQLEREIGSLTRKVLKKILDDSGIQHITVNPKDLESYLGTEKYRYGLADTEDQVGATTGLAYTEVGGDLLTVEAVAFPGKGEVKTTGKLGEVIKESAQAAYSCFRVRAATLGLKYEDYKNLDIHLHFPEGATPKDGPSAGTAIFTTIVSLMTNRAVKRNVAMTGEINLRGKVLPIGGLKEKLLAATRGGIKTVLIPKDNEKNLRDIPNEVKNNLRIIPVSTIDEVLKEALV